MFPANLVKKALCVGISYKGQHGPYNLPPKDFELTGSHNDVRKVIGLLTEYYDYKKENITVLLDADGHTIPTKENIISALNRLIDEAKSGENLFFFFAGHGDQITNHDGTEDDGLDEIILPLDWKLDEARPRDDRDRYSQIIIDDDMNNILVKRLPPGCRLTALFDSCHSGTILDLPYSRFFGPRSKSPVKDGYMITASRTASPPPEAQIFSDYQDGSVQPHSHPQSPVDFAQINQIRKDSLGTTSQVQGPAQTFFGHQDGSSQPRSHPQSPVDIARRNQIHRDPLELSYRAINPRGRKDPHWRKGTWILRGETLDGKIQATPPFKFQGLQALSWSACSDGQCGYEKQEKSKSTHENLSGGVMVAAFVDILKNDPYLSYKEILKRLGDRVRKACEKINDRKPRDQKIMQEPQLGSQLKPDLGQLFAP